MNEESARYDLEQKLAAKGYEHPSTTNAKPYSSYSAYSVYNEKGNDVYSCGGFDPYVTVNEEDPAPESNKNDLLLQKKVMDRLDCPTCGEKAQYTCNCTFKDLMCLKGHIWYVDKKGFIISGDPHDDIDPSKVHRN